MNTYFVLEYIINCFGFGFVPLPHQGLDYGELHNNYFCSLYSQNEFQLSR